MLDEFRSAHITWDKATSRIYSTITANESDENGRKLVVQIINGGQVEALTGTTLHLYWITRDKLHDGLDVFKAVDLNKGEFELSYTTGMLSNKGVLNANLVLVDAVGRVVSERFKITVTEGIDNDAIQSENSFSSLTQALIDISDLEQNYAPRLSDLTAQLQQTQKDKNLNYKLASDYATLHDAFNHLDWNNAIILENRKVYTLDRKLTVPIQLGGIKIIGNGATLKFTNHLDCGLDLTATNYNNGNHAIENLQIEGSNIAYPLAGEDTNNKGIGLKVLNNGGVHLTNVRIRQFEVGLLIENSVGCIVDGTSSLMFNNIGMRLDKVSNTHKFYGLKVRENRRKGIELTGGPTAQKPTHNIFYGCYIESNHPHNTAKENTEFSIGVEINDAYDNVFRDCYFENHKYSILLKGGSDKNIFDVCRLNVNTFGNDTIKITGDAPNSNKFIRCIGAIDNTISTVEFDATNTSKSTVFDGCEGFNLDNMIGKATIKNCNNLPSKKFNISNIVLESQGVVANVSEGPLNVPGTITGIGTTTAVLNAKGLGEISFGSQITGATTITNITGLIPNTFLFIYNYQESHKITLKAQERYQNIVLNRNRDIVFDKFGDSVLFWVNGLGRLTAVGQNLNTDHEKTGHNFMLVGTTSLTVTHNFGEAPNRVFVTPRGNIGNTWVTEVTATSFKINCSVAPVGSNVSVDWRVEV